MLATLRSLHTNSLMRRLFLPLLKRFNPGDIQVRHHYTSAPLLLHSFRHKGYWFHGRRRERETMDFFQAVIRPGNTVIEVGGHIGYMTMYFSQLVGEHGEVFVFEPGSNNLPYIHENISDLVNVQLIEKAVSNDDGLAWFFEEELTGQNNSLHSDYELFHKNCQQAYANADYQQREVETIKLDTYLEGREIKPDLIKIDIEGAELMALEGGRKTITQTLPILMVEVTSEKEDVFRLLSEWGYLLYSDKGKLLTDAQQLNINACALHREKHAEVRFRCGWPLADAAA